MMGETGEGCQKVKRKKKEIQYQKPIWNHNSVAHLDGYKNNIKINKYIWNSEGSRIIKNTPKKKRYEGFALADINTNYKGLVTKI